MHSMYGKEIRWLWIPKASVKELYQGRENSWVRCCCSVKYENRNWSFHFAKWVTLVICIGVIFLEWWGKPPIGMSLRSSRRRKPGETKYRHLAWKFAIIKKKQWGNRRSWGILESGFLIKVGKKKSGRMR